ncbi:MULTISPECIES: MFS transporter [unclassified Streptomyces]|uniref:MFS transporter n=1 Tax=unclassified Streptomyces TaxID=2593676 RepID=UPI00224F1367|nr:MULTISPECIES: MFS transporter [unclassified Streptomyces]MCX4524522.1 MFS transporter [Streptomyces sp. NBC_01551]MCX4544953.1 MFS transporter [Streptomyces sp. NBC_01565]
MHGFGRYLAAALAARFASEGMGMAVVLLALERTGSAAYGAYVLTAWLAPHVLAAPLAGAAAARTRRPRLFYVATLSGFTAAAAALAVLLGRAPAPVVLAVAVLGGACGPMVTGGLSSLVAGLVPEGARRDRAYGWDASTYNAASVTAPAVVGLVAALASAAPAMAVLAASGVLAAVLAGSLPYGPPAAAPASGGPRAGLGAGLAALWRVRELRAITSATTLAFVGIGSLTATSVLLAGALGSPRAGGVLMTAFALGALAGSLTLGRMTAVEPGRLARWALAGTGVALAAAALSPSVAVTAALFAVAGVCDGPLLTATLRIRSQYAPEAVRTQVFTLGAGLKLTAASAGAALVGLTAELPAQALLGGIAVLQLAAALLHAAVAARRPVPAASGQSAGAATAPSAGSATAPAGRRTPGAP